MPSERALDIDTPLDLEIARFLYRKKRGAAMNHANDQQIVLVTGALGRLGKTFSKFIVNSGANVFLVDLDEEKGRQLVVELGIHKRQTFLVADITTFQAFSKTPFNLA